VLRYGASAVAATATAIVQVASYPDGFGDRVDAIRALLALVPWFLALPWLKHLDLRPVVWFFLCLFCGLAAAPVLAWKVTYRALSLPYRDWPIEYWHVRLSRAVRESHAVVLVDKGDTLLTVRGRREAAWRSVLKWAWASVLLGFVLLAGAEIFSPIGPNDWVQGIWLLAVSMVGLGHLVGEFFLGLSDRRASKPTTTPRVGGGTP
jgi:hypothetical protein